MPGSPLPLAGETVAPCLQPPRFGGSLHLQELGVQAVAPFPEQVAWLPGTLGDSLPAPGSWHGPAAGSLVLVSQGRVTAEPWPHAGTFTFS